MYGMYLSAVEATVAYVMTKPTIASSTPATMPTLKYDDEVGQR